MKLVALPAFTDNYIWMLHNGRQAIVVDPGDPTPVKTALQDLDLSLEAILVTHHHPDHTGGIEDLKSLCSGQVYGPARHPIDGVDVKVHDGQQIRLLDHVFTAWDTPGHTAGHVSYTVVPQQGLHQGQTLLWCGDTLFLRAVAASFAARLSSSSSHSRASTPSVTTPWSVVPTNTPCPTSSSLPPLSPIKPPSRRPGHTAPN